MTNLLTMRWTTALLLARVLVGCSAPAALPTASAPPTQAPPTAEPATFTPLVPTATATAAPTTTPAPKPTQEPLKTDAYRAPNGWWRAQGWGEFRGETYHAELRVTRADGGAAWTASQDWNAGLGVPLPTPLEWSQDGRYLYYTNAPLVDGCALFVNGSDLWRMDLGDGTVTQLVPDVGLAVSLAPDEQTFGYISYGPQPNLVLHDLATGAERRAPLPTDTQAGGIVWSLDSSVLMLTVAEKACSGEDESHQIIKINTTTLEQSIVLPEEGAKWVTLLWAERGVVILGGKDQAVTLLDPTTNKFWFSRSCRDCATGGGQAANKR